MCIFLALALYRLLKGVDENFARLMVILGSLMATPIYFLNTLNDVAALMLVGDGDSCPCSKRRNGTYSLCSFSVCITRGVVANEVFRGLWLLPFPLLVYRSRFLPRILGVWLILNGFAYLAVSFTGVLFPQYKQMVFDSTFPAMLGEVPTMLWLLIMGAKGVTPSSLRLLKAAAVSAHSTCPPPSRATNRPDVHEADPTTAFHLIVE
jgi:hypothetical protein